VDYLCFADRSESSQVGALFDIVRSDPLLWRALETARTLGLPQWRIVSGVIYNTVWNSLTGRPSGYGIKDIDLFYFDDSDIGWEAEDRIIRRGTALFGNLAVPVEIRNQARVHLWYEGKFGTPYPALSSTDASIDRFASKTHSVGLRLEADGALDLNAPYGLNDIFSFRVVPNRLLDNAKTHTAKGCRIRSLWPEVSVEPW
jgi:uncharacterized protein